MIEPKQLLNYNFSLMTICEYFRKMSLRKRFIFVFSTTTLLTVLAVLILIQLQLVTIRRQTTERLDEVHLANVNVSSMHNIEALLVSYQIILNSYANKVRQLVTSYQYFTQNQNFYSSNEPLSSPPNCNILNPNSRNYSIPCIYNYNGNSTYPSHSFFDILLTTLLPYAQQFVKRINIIYYNNNTNNVTTVRTYPATKISLNNLSVIQNIYKSLSPQYINISDSYNDIFNTSNTPQMALSTVVSTQDPNTQIILQIQINYLSVMLLYRNVLYFPGSVIIYAYYNPDMTGDNVEILSISNSTFNSSTAKNYIYEIVANNQVQITIMDMKYTASWIHFSQSFPIDTADIFSTIHNSDGNYYIIQLVPSAIMNGPYDLMATYLKNQSSIIGVGFGFTSIIAFMTVVSFSFMAANGISSRLNKISKSVNKYLNGEDHNVSTIRLKKLSAQNLMKSLVQNIINLIRKIQQNKADFANTTSTYKYLYPQNEFDIQFLRRIGSKSADLWPSVQTILINKYRPRAHSISKSSKR